MAMKSPEDFIKKQRPDILHSLKVNFFLKEIADLMRDYAIEFATAMMPDDNFPALVKEMRQAQNTYFATRKKGALIRAKELEKKVDEYFKKMKS